MSPYGIVECDFDINKIFKQTFVLRCNTGFELGNSKCLGKVVNCWKAMAIFSEGKRNWKNDSQNGKCEPLIRTLQYSM